MMRSFLLFMHSESLSISLKASNSDCNTWVVVDLRSHLQGAGQLLFQLLQLEVNTVEVVRHTDSPFNGSARVSPCT